MSTNKKRPALIISPDEYNKGADIIIAFITSNLSLDYKIGDYKIKDWERLNLPKPSMIRMKFATIDKSIIIKKIGKLNNLDIKRFYKILTEFLKS